MSFSSSILSNVVAVVLVKLPSCIRSSQPFQAFGFGGSWFKDPRRVHPDVQQHKVQAELKASLSLAVVGHLCGSSIRGVGIAYCSRCHLRSGLLKRTWRGIH